MNKISFLPLVALLLVHCVPASSADYDLYLLAGQSNMDGRGKADDLTEAQRQPLKSVVMYYRNPPHTTDGWKPLGPGFSIPPRFKGDLPSSTFGPELGFAAAMTKAQPDRQFAFIKGSKGGTSLRKDWNPGVKGEPETQGPCYRDFIETFRLATEDLTQAGHRFKLCGLLWHQGESDSKSSTEVYQELLTHFIERIREDTGEANLPVVVGEVFDNGRRDTVRAAQRSVGNTGDRCGFVSSEGTTTWDEGTHFDAASQWLLGERFADAMLIVNGIKKRPNVVLIMTDDQGYGDLSCHGNPVLNTPNLDLLSRESIRITNFHVSPFCTPTRAALMTGRYPARTGAYRTSSGRTMMHTDERTIANVFADNGYATGMVGKWHLGDNSPHRPQDRGFGDVVWHRCGGVGQASDYWRNDYFDDTYERNGQYEKFEGYCTDVWFKEAAKFVSAKKDKPFFLYLATNAPHGPYLVGDEWKTPYEGKADWRSGPEFYGMIANFDHNLGLFREHLAALGLADNTILIYMTDNGTANGAAFGTDTLNSEAVRGFNAGMRGKKSSIYEGGHRVPFFIHWPEGGLADGRDIDHLSAHIDVFPTLAELCGIRVPDSHKLDGVSFATALQDAGAAPHRDHLIVQFQGGAHFTDAPKPWESTAVLNQRWRLINGKELHDIQADPAQRVDVSSAHTDVVKQLRSYYLPWWESVSPRMAPVCIDVGNNAENPTTLCSQDWYLESGNPPWNFGAIRKLPRVTGPWNVDVRKAGRYRLTLRQWPKEANKPVVAVRAKVQIAGEKQEVPVKSGSKAVVFELDLPAGPTELWTYLYDEKGKAGGAYFTEVELLD